MAAICGGELTKLAQTRGPEARRIGIEGQGMAPTRVGVWAAMCALSGGLGGRG